MSLMFSSRYQRMDLLFSDVFELTTGTVSEQVLENVKEYVREGEYGVAYDLLVYTLENKEVRLSDELANHLDALGALLDPDSLKIN